MKQIPDPDYIRNAERYGIPPDDDDPDPVCPVCGKECETIYFNKDGEPFACDCCVKTKDAWEYQEENKEE